MEITTIIIVNDFAHVQGGAGQVALTSALALAKSNYKVILFTAVPPVDSNLLDENLEVICLDQHEILKDPNRLNAAVQGLWNIKAARSMSSLLERQNPNTTVIHLHSWTKALSSSIVRTAIKNNFRIVCTMHDYFLACPNGGFYDYKDESICHLTPLSTKCLLKNCDVRSYPQKLWRVTRQMIQQRIGLLPRGIKNFIAISEFSRKILDEYLPHGAHVYPVDNPIDITDVGPISVAKNHEYVFVGRLSKEKGGHLLAEASLELGVQATFIGDGYTREEILHINPNIYITGWLPRQNVITSLQRARTLVFPSMWYETQGLVVAEASALGIPAIVANTSAAKDAIIDGKTGLLFKSGNTDDLLEKMKMLLDDKYVEKLGLNAYTKYWSSPMTIEKHVQQLELCYKQVLSNDAT